MGSIHHQPPTIEPDPLHWMHLILASNHNTLLTHGIFAILGLDVLMKILVNGAQKLLGILITILGAVKFYVPNQHFTVSTVLIILQVHFSGITVIYLDDVLKGGYGLLSGAVHEIQWKNILVNLLGDLADLHRDPLHAFIYAVFVLISCVLISMWLIVCAPSKGVLNGRDKDNKD
uniref:Uncharacterized protein n=1 Tax=Oryza punctata TaxID=4537 RepID=A0A0E0MP82_ORYPU